MDWIHVTEYSMIPRTAMMGDADAACAAYSVEVPAAGKATVANQFSNRTQMIRLVATSPCFVAIKTSEQAARHPLWLPADRPEFIAVRPGYSLVAIGPVKEGLE